MRLIAIYCCTIVPYLHKLRIGKSKLELKINDENCDKKFNEDNYIYFEMYILFIYKYC